MWNYYKLNTEGLQNNEEIIRDSAVRTFDKATPHPRPGLTGTWNSISIFHQPEAEQ